MGDVCTCIVARDTPTVRRLCGVPIHPLAAGGGASWEPAPRRLWGAHWKHAAPAAALGEARTRGPPPLALVSPAKDRRATPPRRAAATPADEPGSLLRRCAWCKVTPGYSATSPYGLAHLGNSAYRLWSKVVDQAPGLSTGPTRFRPGACETGKRASAAGAAVTGPATYKCQRH